MSKPAADGARWSQARVGTPQVAVKFNKFDTHSTAQFPIGFKVEDAKGNVYRYAHFSADTNRGVLVSPDLSETSYVDTDGVIIASGSVTLAGANVAGSKDVEISLASITANDFAGGSLVITDDAGEGYTYDIVGNTATTGTGSVVTFTLDQEIQTTIGSATDFAILPAKYSNLEIATTTDIAPIGVTCSTMDVSAKPFGWIQTCGDVGILQDGTITVGDVIQLSDGTAGGSVQIFGGDATSAVSALDMNTEPILGYCIIAGDDGGHGGFRIQCE